MRDEATDVVEDDGDAGKGAREAGQFQNLRVVDHGVERQLTRLQCGEAGTKLRFRHQPARHNVTARVQRRVGVPFGGDAYAAKSPCACCH